MKPNISETRLSQVKDSLVRLCRDSGILMVDDIEESFCRDLFEAGIVDSLGVVCLQEQIETHYRVEISQERFVAELHTLDKLVHFLAVHSTAEVPA